MNVIRLFNLLEVPGAPGPRSGPGSRSESGPKSDHQIHSNVEVENTSQTPTLKTNRKKIDSN